MPAPLHHDRITASPEARPTQWLYVLHGIFGAGRNWASIVRRVGRARPEWGGVLVDLREHGRSRGFPPPHTLAAAAGDLAALVQATGLPASAVLGHSFGGKVALLFAREHALAAGTRHLWIVDSLPAPVPSPRGSAWEMLGLLRRNPGPFATRADAVAALEAQGVANGVAQWISSNLEPLPGDAARQDAGGAAGHAGASGPLGWRLDLDAIEALLRDFFATDLWDVVEDPPDGLRIDFLKAEGSDVMPEPVVQRIEEIGRANARVQLHKLEGGHWLNADNPAGVEEVLVKNL
ncbi:MAG TPA: alpha/beta hydrolase [Longimicrobiales bacterium]